MSTLIRFLLTAFLALVLVTGQGFAVASSWAAACCPQNITHQLPDCCQEGGCEKHKAVETPSVKHLVKQQLAKCVCGPTTVDLQYEKSFSLSDGGLLLVGIDHPNPVLSLQLADSGAPIWLRRLFYPDRSRLFLEKNSWLL
jgi:hypothetical protein